ncbi:GSCOCG00013553001-RA-CDS, partial [Cotesia congregata]
MSDNFRLVASDNLNSISDNIPLIHSTSTKTTLMTDNSSFINYNSPIVVDNSSLTTSDNKTIIFSDNVPLINVDNSGVISGVDNTCLTNSIISIDNSINNNSTLIGGDNLKISATTGDNSTISDDDINSTVNKNNVFVKMRNHPDYSDIYNVIVDSDNDGDDIDDNEILMMRKQLLPGVQESLGNLHQQYETKVKNIKDVVEENIKQFTAKQYEYLENYKDKGHHHYYVLTNKILRNEFKKMKRENIQVIADIQSSDDIEKEEKDKTELVSKPKITGDSVRPITQDNNFIVPGSLIYSDNNNKMTTDGKRVDINREKEGGEKRAKRKQMKNYNGDIDDEVIFAIEGMDDND